MERTSNIIEMPLLGARRRHSSPAASTFSADEERFVQDLYADRDALAALDLAARQASNYARTQAAYEAAQRREDDQPVPPFVRVLIVALWCVIILYGLKITVAS